MPRERIYTDSGYLEVQWAKSGQLVCIVSAEIHGHAAGCDAGAKCGEPSNCPPRETMHQFTDDDGEQVIGFATTMRRAARQAYDPSLAVMKVNLSVDPQQMAEHARYARDLDPHGLS